jgi:hypothetical protein
VLAAVPRDAAKILKRSATPVFVELAAALDDVAAALESRDHDAAWSAVMHARGVEELATGLREMLDLAVETVRLAPLKRRERGRVERYSTASTFLGVAIRNTRVLARAAVRAVELEPSIPATLVASIRDLATAVRRLEVAVDHGTRDGGVAEATRAAAAAATQSYDEGMGFAIGALVGQVRSIALDILRASGSDRGEAVRELREAAGGEPRATLRR